MWTVQAARFSLLHMTANNCNNIKLYYIYLYTVHETVLCEWERPTGSIYGAVRKDTRYYND